MTPINVGQIVYKKVLSDDLNRTCRCGCGTVQSVMCVATLEVLEGGFIADYDNKEGHYNSLHKGRVASAKVLSIVSTDDPTHVQNGYSVHNGFFKYVVGETVSERLDPTNTACASGIHCFETFEQAENYYF